MLAAILAGVSPAGGNYPVATVAITGDGAGDETVGRPVVKNPRGLDANPVRSVRRVNKSAGRSASEP